MQYKSFIHLLLFVTALTSLIFGASHAYAASTLVAGEYFIDIDPGEGKGTPVIAKDGVFNGAAEDVELALDTSNLNSGVHRFYLRMQTDAGVWSIPSQLVFNVEGPKAVADEEYYIDTDPGEGLGTPLTPTNGVFSQAPAEGSATFDTKDLTVGIHSLYVRAKDSESHWGTPRVLRFEVATPPIIAALEYYLDSDPGLGMGFDLTPSDGDFSSALASGQASLDTSSLTEGVHTLYARTQASDQIWSVAKSLDLTVLPAGDKASTGLELTLNPDWNLLGARMTIDVASTLGNFTSVWKWESGKWEVRLPNDVAGDSGNAYAEGKGFVLLSTINPGEGFWVNNSTTTIAKVSPIAAPSDGTTSLTKDWNLIGLRSASSKKASVLFGAETPKIVSIWKWVNGKWAVLLPNDAAGDGGQAYATGKGFELLVDIHPGDGFWVNASSEVILP